MNEYLIKLKGPGGNILLPTVPYTKVEWVRSERQVGWMSLQVPGGLVDQAMVVPDSRLEIWRGVTGAPMYLEGGTPWIVRLKQLSGRNSDLYVEAADLNYLLSGAIVDYNASTDSVTNAYSDKTDYADDLIKAFVYENIGVGAVITARRNPLVTVADDHSLGVSMRKQCSRRNLLTTCQEIADACMDQGTYLTWDWFMNSNGGFTIETYINQLGVLRDYVASVENGNLLDPTYVEDYRTEVTYMEAGGKGEGAARAVGSASGARVSSTPFSRREAFASGYNTSNTATLNTEAQALLQANGARKQLNGSFASTPSVEYGVNLFFGDRLHATYAGSSFECRVSTVHGVVDCSSTTGYEQIDIKLSGEAAL